MTSYILTQSLRAIIFLVAIVILVELIESKDGQLRKILIAYFGVEIFIYAGAFLYLIAYPEKSNPISIIWMLPKVAVKIWFYIWLVKNKRKPD